MADGTISIFHVSGKSNVSDIFTKEMRDGANFRRLRDSFMCRSSDYLKGILPGVPNPSDAPLPVLAQSTATVPAPRPGMLDVLVTYPGPRLRIPAGFLQDSFIFLLERFQLKERRSFCEGTLKKSRTDREGTAGTSFLF